MFPPLPKYRDWWLGGGFSLQHYCAGAIINEYQVLTAAHCFSFPSSADEKSWIVLVGSNNNSLPLAELGKDDLKSVKRESEKEKSPREEKK